MEERERGASWLKRDNPTGKESPLFQVNRETRSRRRRRRMILTGRGVVLRQATGSRYRARVLANSTVFQRATTRLLVGRSSSSSSSSKTRSPIPRCKRRGGPQQDSPVRAAVHTRVADSLHVHARVGYKSLAVAAISPCGGLQEGMRGARTPTTAEGMMMMMMMMMTTIIIIIAVPRFGGKLLVASDCIPLHHSPPLPGRRFLTR